MLVVEYYTLLMVHKHIFIREHKQKVQMYSTIQYSEYKTINKCKGFKNSLVCISAFQELFSSNVQKGFVRQI